LQASLKELDLTTKDKKKGAKTQVKDENEDMFLEESHLSEKDEAEPSANFLNDDSVDGVDERAEKKR